MIRHLHDNAVRCRQEYRLQTPRATTAGLFRRQVDSLAYKNLYSVRHPCNEWIRLATEPETPMTAQSTRVRSIVPGHGRFRFVEHIDVASPSGVTERPAPLARLEGPDISLSGRQILLKARV